MILDSGTNAQNAISATDLVKTYRSGLFGRNKFHALKGVSFEVPVGSIFGLLGPNGAGKTTFVKTLLGVIRKTSGNAKIFQYNSGSRVAKKMIGYLPERLVIPSYLTGYQALSFYGGLSDLSASTIRQKRDELLDQVGLSGWGSKPVSKYSKGMVQRLGLAQALCNDPALLILDEPTDGLDPEARAGVREILRNLQQKGVTIFLNSHLLQEVELVCEEVAIMAEGTLRYCGPVDQVESVLRKKSSVQNQSVTFCLRSLPEEAKKMELPASFQELPRSDSDKQEGVHNFEESFADYSSMNKRIDFLRAKGLEIVSVTPQRVSLEDAFLELVKPSGVDGSGGSASGLTQAGMRSE